MKVFDIVVAQKKFAQEHPDIVTKFLKVVDDSTRYYRKNLEESHKLIGGIAGISPEKTADIMGKMQFFTKDEQVSSKWMGTKEKPGELVDFIKSIAEFSVEEKAMDKALEDYSSTVDPSYYQAVKD